MAKITLNPTSSGYDLAKINDNFVQIADHLNNKVLYRNNPTGEPNALITPLDTNGLRIYNLPAPTDNNDAARKIDADGGSGGSTSASSVTFAPYSWDTATNVQTAIQQVVDRVTTDEGIISSNTSRITAAEGVNTTQTTELANHEGRITTLEGTVGFDGNYLSLTNKPPLTGGTTGQVLTKTSGTDYAFNWQTPSGGGGGSGTVTNTSGVLTANQIVVGNGTVDVKALGSLGTTTQVLKGNAAGLPTWGAVVLSTDVSGTLPATAGGTGQTIYAVGDIVYASTTTALSKLADVATGNVLISGGVGVAPSYGKVGLTSHVTGSLPVANGGTGTTTSTGSGDNVLGSAPTFAGNITINGAAATQKYLRFSTAGNPRWVVQADSTSETGSNAGSNYSLSSFDDSGTLIESVFSIVRSTGVSTIKALTVTNILKPTALQETKVAVAALNIDLATANLFSKTISGASTLTVSNVPTTGTAATFILDLTNGGSAVVTWWSGVKWAAGTAPTLTTAGRDVLGFFTHDGGTTWTGLLLGKDVK